MAQINLLPWREERREELKRQFFVVLFGVAIVGAGSVYLVDMKFQNAIERQESRNDFIKQEMTKLDEQIDEIKSLKKQRKDLVARMEVIQNLQGNRPIVVRIFDELARTLPEGVFLTSIEKKSGVYIVQGKAESNNKVSNFMRNLDSSIWFKEPNLSRVRADNKPVGDSDITWSRFDLTVMQSLLADNQEAEE